MKKDLNKLLKLPAEQLRKEVLKANMELHEKFADMYDIEHPQQLHKHYQDALFSDIYELCTFVARNKPLSNIKILDLGSGTGFLTSKLLSIADFPITGVDISKTMLNKQKKNLKHLNAFKKLKFVVGDAIEFCSKTKEKYDLVVMSAFLHHVFDVEEVINAAVKCVGKRGGIYIAYEPLKDANMDENVFKFHCLLREVDNLLQEVKKLKNHRARIYDDETLADFHSLKGGISPEIISKILEENGFTVKTNYYYARFNEYISWFGGNMIGARNNFSILAKRG